MWVGQQRRKARGGRRAVSAVAVGLLMTVVGVFGSAAPAAAEPTGTRDFRKVPDGLTVLHTPPGISNKPVTVVAELAGDPVAVAEADAPLPLTTDQKRQRKDQIKQRQAPVLDRIRAARRHGAG